MEEQSTPRGENGQPTKARKQKWAPRHYNRPEGFYSRLGAIGGSSPHERPPGYFERIGAMGGAKRERVKKPRPSLIPARRDVGPTERAELGDTPAANLGSSLVDDIRERAKPRGEMTVREAGRRGGRKVREERGLEYYAAIGRDGGQALLESRGRDHFVTIGQAGAGATLERHGAEHFVEIGKAGGIATKAKHGPEYYAEIGRKGGRAGKGKPKRQSAPLDEHAPPAGNADRR